MSFQSSGCCWHLLNKHKRSQRILRGAFEQKGGKTQWVKSWGHKEVKAKKERKNLALLRVSATQRREGTCCQLGFKAESSLCCCIHLQEMHKCDLFTSELLRVHDLKWEVMNDSPVSASSPKETRLSRDLGHCSSSPSSPTVPLIL